MQEKAWERDREKYDSELWALSTHLERNNSLDETEAETVAFVRCLNRFDAAAKALRDPQ